MFDAFWLYPQAAGYLLDRIAAKDTVLMLPRRDDPSVKEPVFVKKGSRLILDMVGMCASSPPFHL